MMDSNKQIQKAGDNSHQYQVNTMIVNGITEKRVREIFEEQNQIARRDYTEDAYRIAEERVCKFENSFMPRIIQIENALPLFADPAFQFLLRQAQQTAAATEIETDYDLLTELLVCHVQKGADRKNKAAIKHAVSMVGDIDNDALCALTIAHALLTFGPSTGNCIAGVSKLNDLFSKIMYRELPTGSGWLDHLDMLGAVRIMSFGGVESISEYYSHALNGYICVGIRMDSDEYSKALEILKNMNIDQSILVPNDCLEGFYRLAIRNEQYIGKLGLDYGNECVPLNTEQIIAVKQIWDMYSKDNVLMDQVINNFIQIWDSFENLRKMRKWWDSIPNGFSITQVGRVLAQTNAKRCDPALPDLI